MTKAAVSPLDVLWGVKAIADYIGRSHRETYHLIKLKIIPTRKAGYKTVIGIKPEIDRALAALPEREDA